MVKVLVGLKGSGKTKRLVELVRRAVDASLDACVRTPEIQVDGGPRYGTRAVGQWIADYIRQA